MPDPAPIAYDEEGNPVKVRVIEGECEGDISGEGHYGYRLENANQNDVTVYFEEVDDA